MIEIRDHPSRVAAALRGAIAAQAAQDTSGAAGDMLLVAESIAACGGLDTDDLRGRQLGPAAGPAMLVRMLPFGLATPLERPRLRRESYRCAGAFGADEGTALAGVAAALVIADLLRFDPSTTALRVRQSLLEDAPMALLDRLAVLHPESEVADGASDPGAALQVALSVLEWTGCSGVTAALARMGETGRGDVGILAGALAGAAAGECDVPIDGAAGERADAAAHALTSLPAATGAVTVAEPPLIAG